jgi:hypothetical protein
MHVARFGKTRWSSELQPTAAQELTASFTPEQRRILFKWFNDIAEDTPWGPRRRWRRTPRCFSCGQSTRILL